MVFKWNDNHDIDYLEIILNCQKWNEYNLRTIYSIVSCYFRRLWTYPTIHLQINEFKRKLFNVHFIDWMAWAALPSISYLSAEKMITKELMRHIFFACDVRHQWFDSPCRVYYTFEPLHFLLFFVCHRSVYGFQMSLSNCWKLGHVLLYSFAKRSILRLCWLLLRESIVHEVTFECVFNIVNCW